MKNSRRRFLAMSASGSMIAGVIAALGQVPYHRQYTGAAGGDLSPGTVKLDLQRRDTAGAVIRNSVNLDPAKAAVVVVDMWTQHHCPAAAAAFEAMLPDMNQTLDALRKLGIQVVFASSGDDLKRWDNKPQRLRITKLEDWAMPMPNGFMGGKMPDRPYAFDCLCKITSVDPVTKEPFRLCRGQELLRQQHPKLKVKDQDLFIAAGHYRKAKKGEMAPAQTWGEPGQQELWNLAQEEGITHLIYTGVATNMCVTDREFGMVHMKRLNLVPILVRDLTLSMTYNGYNPFTKKLDPNFTPVDGTALGLEYIEKEIGATIDRQQLIRAAAVLR